MKRLILLVVSLGLLTFSACDKNFETINQDPNAIHNVTPDLLLPGIIRGSVNVVMTEGWSIGNLVSQHTARIQFVNEDRYLWGDRSGIWNTLYGVLRDVNNLEGIADAGEMNNYKGISLIMRAWIFSVLTDLYGDIPYSEAIRAKSDKLLKPAYDRQETIYQGILDDLAEANALLGSTGEQISGDILYAGNISQWKKLANSLTIRYLMRISDQKNIAAELGKILADPATYPVFQDVADGAQMNYLAESPNQFPLHTYRTGTFDECRLSKKLGDELIRLGDNRLQVYARPTDASQAAGQPVYVGIPNGLNDVDAYAYNGGAQNVSRVGRYYYEDAITTQGRQIAKGYIMGYPELLFLLAEASAKGWIQADTEALYMKGIESSFSSLGQRPDPAYFEQDGVRYQDGQALRLIGSQKWIALYFTGMEAWFDWRRTHLPEILPGPSNQNGDRVPVRYTYPIAERSLNAENLKNAISVQGADDLNTKVWWDVN